MPFYTGHIAAASNRADLLFQVQLIDPKTNDNVDFTGATITVALRPVTGGNSFAAATLQRLTGTNHDGHVSVIGSGLFEVKFTRAEMAQFSAGDLDIGITVLLNDGITYQLFAGQLPVVDGVVAARSLTAYPTLRLKLTMPQALKLQFLPAIPGSNAAASAAAAQAAADAAQAAANTAVAATANKVDKSGDVMTGFLTLNADPLANLQAATKQYVDAHSGGGGGGAPVGAEYITSTADATLTAERVLTDTATITWDRTTPGQIKASTAAGGGNVSNSGTPTVGQYAKWVTATTIQGVAVGTVLTDIGAQPVDPDLTAIAALTGTNTIYYRSATNTWTAVNISTGLAFSGGNLTSTVTSGAPVGAEYITSTADATLTSERVLTDTATVTWDRTTAGQIKATAVSSGGGTSAPQGRLTLQTATPVMTTTQSAKTAIFYTPYVGNQILLYNGASMVPTTFSELTVATTDTASSPAAIGASKCNDWFVWDSGGGTLRLIHGPDWTNDTTRSAGTALVMIAGTLLNAVAITNGPAIQRGTYVGTTRSNASSQLDWIFGGASPGGTPASLYVWNQYNRVSFSTTVMDTTNSWSYGTATWQATNASSGNRVRYVTGQQEDTINALTNCYLFSAASIMSIGLGFDSTTVVSGLPGNNAIGGSNAFTLSAFFLLYRLGRILFLHLSRRIAALAGRFWLWWYKWIAPAGHDRHLAGLTMDAGTLNDAIVDAGCPTSGTKVGKSDDRATWSFIPASGATQPQIDSGNNVIATIPIDPLGLAATGDFVSRFTNAEYLALQKLRTTDNGKMAKDWDNVTSDSNINMNKKKTQTLKTNLVAAGILTQARADVIFV